MFTNYFEKILAFFNHLPLSVDIFYGMKVDKKIDILRLPTYLPCLVNVYVCMYNNLFVFYSAQVLFLQACHHFFMSFVTKKEKIFCEQVADNQPRLAMYGGCRRCLTNCFLEKGSQKIHHYEKFVPEKMRNKKFTAREAKKFFFGSKIHMF